MSDALLRTQPAPAPNDRPLVRDVVIKDLTNLCEHRRVKYGTHLQPYNGRDALWDAYEEALDLCLYLRQALMERE
jgi:hypothetical protein